MWDDDGDDVSAPDEPRTSSAPSAPVPPPPGADGTATRPAQAPRTSGPAAPPDDVPDLDDRRRPLEPRVVVVWRVSAGLGLLVPAVVVSVLAIVFLGGRGVAVPIVALAMIGAFVSWYPKARYDRWRWRLTDLAVELERGVVIRTAEALPYFRIQQIDVNQGPVDRLLGLASLQVTSASASGSVTLPGIAADDAPNVRRALLARAAAAVGEHDSGVRDAV